MVTLGLTLTLKPDHNPNANRIYPTNLLILTKP